MSDEKEENDLSSKEKKELKDEGQERALVGDDEPNSLMDEVFDTEEQKETRKESFDHTHDEARDEKTRQSVAEEDDE